MKKRILLADDDNSVRRMVARVLESAGYGVLPANSAGDRQGKNSESRVDLMLLDLPRPDEEGWDALETVRREYRQVPVIVMTSWPNQNERAVRQGINVLLEKPLDLERLLDSIRALLTEPQQPAMAEASALAGAWRPQPKC